jgi:hypothetical protein
VLVTNGDNLYDPQFLEHLSMGAARGADLVAFDFYSRYQRPTQEPCVRFAATPHAPACRQNELRVCHTDLASVAWRLQRLLKEDRRFGEVDTFGNSEAADGILAAAVVAAGWKVR